MYDLEKLKKHGYNGAGNPFAIFMWLIVEKRLYPEVYFSKFDGKWHQNNYLVDTKTASSVPWEHTDKGFDTYKEIVDYVVKIVIKML